MRKRLVVALLVCSMGLVGCGQKASEPTEEIPQENAQEGKENETEEKQTIEQVKNTPTEYTIESMMGNDYPESIDISGCGTFTQIVDEKLSEGMGYTNVTIGDEDVLLVCSGTWDNQDENNAAMDAIIYVYIDGVPTELGKVSSQGTAYPLTLADNCIISAGHQYICKYTINNMQLQIEELASVEWAQDDKSKDMYFYQADDGKDYSDMSQEDTEAKYDQLLEEMSNGTVINFDVIK